MQFIGCHLTISKGYLAMGRQALEVGGNTAQFFTRNPRGGKARDLDPADVAAFLIAIPIGRSEIKKLEHMQLNENVFM